MNCTFVGYVARQLSVHRACRTFATRTSFDPRQPYTVVDDDGVVVCWHPAKPHPYEHTKAIDVRVLNEQTTTAGPLRDEITALGRRDQRYGSNGPTDEQLQNMFHTFKYEWQPKPLKKRMDRVRPADPVYRDGI